MKKGKITLSQEQLKTFTVINRFIDKSVSDETKKAVLKIYSRPELSGVNFLHFQDILLADLGIHISYSALYSILKMQVLKAPKRKNRHRTHRRKRKPHPGQLIQIDATPYEWFGGNAKYALHGAIDDATGNVVGLFLTQNECLYGYLETMRQCCVDFGVPQTVYSDNPRFFAPPRQENSLQMN